jgi:hypothetical protein
VCRRLLKNKNSVGVVDEDPESIQPSYLRRLELISKEHGIKLLYDRQRGNYVVVLCPTLEGWILKAAEDAGADLSRYGLPTVPEELHKVINLKIKNYEKMLCDIRNSERVSRLRQLLKVQHAHLKSGRTPPSGAVHPPLNSGSRR